MADREFVAEIAEAERLDALRGYAVLDTAPEAVFDDLTRLAAQVCQVPIALVSLVDEDRQWFKSHLGLEVCSTAREVSFCAYTLETAELLVVPDALLDPRFVDNELVTGAPWIRFYAGAPLVDEAGYTLGTLCVLDTEPRELTGVQIEQLLSLARQTMAQLALRRSSAELAENRLLLDSLLEHSPSAIYAKDLNGSYLLGNSAFRSILGRDTNLLGRSDFDLFPRSVAVQLQANDMAIAQTRVQETFTEQVPLPRGGAVRDYLSTKFPLYDASGDGLCRRRGLDRHHRHRGRTAAPRRGRAAVALAGRQLARRDQPDQLGRRLRLCQRARARGLWRRRRRGRSRTATPRTSSPRAARTRRGRSSWACWPVRRSRAGSGRCSRTMAP